MRRIGAGRAATRCRRRRPPGRAGLVHLGAAAAAAAVAAGLWHSGWPQRAAEAAGRAAAAELARAGLRVEEVYLRGRRHESAATISRALGIRRGMPILAVDLDAARRRLEALPWIRSAGVARELPGTIRVRVAEREPLAFWQRRGRLVLVDRDGAAITDENLARFPELVVLVGADAPRHAAALLAMLSETPELAKRVNAAVRRGGRRWDIRIDDVYVRLPKEDPDDAWRRFARIEEQHGLLGRNPASIDLRIPGQLIVRVRGEEPLAKGGRRPREKT